MIHPTADINELREDLRAERQHSAALLEELKELREELRETQAAAQRITAECRVVKSKAEKLMDECDLLYLAMRPASNTLPA